MINIYILDIDVPQVTLSTTLPVEYHNLTLSCFIASNPSIDEKNFLWKHGGKFVSHGHTLLLTNLTSLNSGIYQCSAVNDAGLTLNSTEVEVSCKMFLILFKQYTDQFQNRKMIYFTID